MFLINLLHFGGKQMDTKRDLFIKLSISLERLTYMTSNLKITSDWSANDPKLSLDYAERL